MKILNKLFKRKDEKTQERNWCTEKVSNDFPMEIHTKNL